MGIIAASLTGNTWHLYCTSSVGHVHLHIIFVNNRTTHVMTNEAVDVALPRAEEEAVVVVDEG